MRSKTLRLAAALAILSPIGAAIAQAPATAVISSEDTRLTAFLDAEYA